MTERRKDFLTLALSVSADRIGLGRIANLVGQTGRHQRHEDEQQE